MRPFTKESNLQSENSLALPHRYDSFIDEISLLQSRRPGSFSLSNRSFNLGPLHSKSRRINCWLLFRHDSLSCFESKMDLMSFNSNGRTSKIRTRLNREKKDGKEERKRERERSRGKNGTRHVQVEKMNASPLDTPHYSVSAIFSTFSHF